MPLATIKTTLDKLLKQATKERLIAAGLQVDKGEEESKDIPLIERPFHYAWNAMRGVIGAGHDAIDGIVDVFDDTIDVFAEVEKALSDTTKRIDDLIDPVQWYKRVVKSLIDNLEDALIAIFLGSVVTVFKVGYWLLVKLWDLEVETPPEEIE